MKRKPLYTNLTLEECEAFFKAKITLKSNRSIISYGSKKYIGEFHGNEFYIASEDLLYSFISDDTVAVLQGRFRENSSKAKNKIEYEFGISYVYIVHCLIATFILSLLFMSWWGDIGMFIDFFFRFSIFTAILMIILSLIFYRKKHNIMLAYVREMFQCEDNE